MHQRKDEVRVADALPGVDERPVVRPRPPQSERPQQFRFPAGNATDELPAHARAVERRPHLADYFAEVGVELRAARGKANHGNHHKE